MAWGEYMDDCIHLKACRRLTKIAKRDTGRIITRGCNAQCTAYMTNDDYVEEAALVCERLVADAKSGYSEDDLCVECRSFLKKAFSDMEDDI